MKILTARQAQVAALIEIGLSSKQIARRLDTSVSAVVTHQKRAARKLGCQGTSARAAIAAAMARRRTLQEALDAMNGSASLGQAKARVRALIAEAGL